VVSPNVQVIHNVVRESANSQSCIISVTYGENCYCSAGYVINFVSLENLYAGVPSPKQRLDILLTLLGEMEHALLDMQVEHLAMVTHGYVGADLASLCNEAALVCLRRYVKFKYSCPDLVSSSASVACEGCSDVIIDGSDCLEVTRDISKDYADSATSSVSNLSVSSEIRPPFTLKGTVPEHADHIIDGFEEECRLRVAFEDFEKARIKVRPSAMREVLFMRSHCLENHFCLKYI
jgi:SpoVK/Ycf46/Vps4 family AAA+-type ATPase